MRLILKKYLLFYINKEMSSVGTIKVRRVVKKVKKPVVEETPVEVSEQVQEVVEETPVEPVQEEQTVEEVQQKEQSTLEYITALLENVNVLSKSHKEVENELRKLKTLYIKEQKQNKKKTKRPKNPNRKNGFAGHSSISSDLSSFLGLQPDEKIARPEVTKLISAYIKENELFNAENKSIFTPDEKLRKLLGDPVFPISKKNPELGNGYTYFNLQSYLKKMNHFVV
ncbi:MAG: hypothetical protein RLZZ546_2727 [Bacteroidota bacterium]